MSIEQRVRTCRLLEKMKSQEDYSKRLGLENRSTMNGKQMYQKECDLIKKG